MGVDLFLTLLWQFGLCMLLDALLGLHETNFQQIRILLLFGDFWPVPNLPSFVCYRCLVKSPTKGCLEYLAALNTSVACLDALNTNVV